MAYEAREDGPAQAEITPDLEHAIETARASFGALLSLLDTGRGVDATSAASDTPAVARRLYRERRARDLLLGTALFGEPAWDMLLELYIAKAEGRRVTTMSACMASGVPPTTALRWLMKLDEAGLVRRSHDSCDARLAMVDLTDEAASRMAELLNRLAPG
jgi:DNA-binding MarR family transcriptional regulator